MCLPKQYVGGKVNSDWWEAGATMDLVNCLLKQCACLSSLRVGRSAQTGVAEDGEKCPEIHFGSWW